MRRLLSHSETQALLSCQFRHAFSYTGALTGGEALAPKTTAPLLRDGRAWGRAVAAFHSANPDGPAAEVRDRIFAALAGALAEDAEEQQRVGLYDADEHQRVAEELEGMLAHYIAEAPMLPIEQPEHEIVVPIPSRGGRRRSNRYRFQAFLDGIHVDSEGRHWIVEFKLRKKLSSLELIVLSRQIRWYAWAWREASGIEPTGVIVDERLKAVPTPVARNKDGRLSARQGCTLADYNAAGGCDPTVREKLASKRWQQRERIFLTAAELDEAGRQLTSVAAQIRDFDSGALAPARNPSQFNCAGCPFLPICATPEDDELIDVLFDRVPAKRQREIADAPAVR